MSSAPPSQFSSSFPVDADPGAQCKSPPLQSEEQQHCEEWEILRNRHKSNGDDAFRRKQYRDAIREYTSALSLDPTHHVILSNRSAAYLSNGEKSKALADARQCVLHIPPGDVFAKGHSRVAAAVMSLGRWSEAREEYSKVLALDPGNLAAQKGLEECLTEEKREKERARRELKRSDSKGRGGLDDKAAEETKAAGKETKAEGKDLGKGGGKYKNGDGDDLLDDFFADVESTAASSSSKVEAKGIDRLVPGAESLSGDAASTGTGTGHSEVVCGARKGTSSIASSSSHTSRADSRAGIGVGTQLEIENKIQNHISDLGTSCDQLRRLLAPNHEWRNLNPFHVLQLPHDASESDISRRYKALSLLVHPDKCSDDRASAAFEYVRMAMRQLGDADKRRHCVALIEQGMKIGRKDYEELKTPETPPSLDEFQSKAVMKLFAEIEMKRRDVERRRRAQEKREREQEDEEKRKEKSEREFDRNWREEDRVENRIGNWRDFQKKRSFGVGADEQGGKKKRKARRG